MDMISVLKEDHQAVETLFGRIEAASARAIKTKEKTFLQIKEALTVHSAVEEEYLYPRMREIDSLRQQAFEANEEHSLVKQLLSELGEEEVGSEVWNAKVKVLIDLVRHHVREEESQYFKPLRSELEPAELRSLGEKVVAFKESFQESPQAASPSAKAPGKPAPRSRSGEEQERAHAP
jgi:hypothetical protein